MRKLWRKIGQAVQLFLVFGGGVVSGLFLAYGAKAWTQRDGLPGGEVLILPLIILLVYLGWQLGAVWREVWDHLP